LTRRAAVLIALALAATGVVIVVLAGGDGGEEGAPADEATEVPGDADPEDVAVIKDWVDTLRRGDVEGAARYFAIPSTAENGPTLIRIESPDDARRFNESLPCGAVLVRAEAAGEFTSATFRLTERPGPGVCGPGAGETAQTAFVIEDHKIVEWRRVATGGRQAPSETI
jgi:limonene-1,2-epoxide hydrolase